MEYVYSCAEELGKKGEDKMHLCLTGLRHLCIEALWRGKDEVTVSFLYLHTNKTGQELKIKHTKKKNYYIPLYRDSNTSSLQ